MLKTQFCLQYTSKTVGDRVSVIIVCGGSSSRMNGIDKIFAEIDGVPVVVRTIKAFENCEAVSDIVIVASKHNLLKMQQLCEAFGFRKVTDIIEGGSYRQESVKNGFEALTDKTGFVLIHDGARPLVSNDCIMRVIDGVKKHSAVTCAVKSKDTVKIIGNDGVVTATPDRERLVSVQTPQGFDYSLYKFAVEKCSDMLDTFTDDCSLVESCGYPVYIVEGDYKNIKITTAEDLLIAEILVKYEV